MANIKNLQMWNDICVDARISIKKSLFGFRTVALYNPTGSIIDAHVLELSSDDGEQLKHILSAPREEISKAVAGFRPKAITNGNYLAEVCTSRDGNYLAVNLLQFSIINYEPVTDVLVFEGDEARAVGKLF
ncbi:MAG: hypothetical protein J6W03_08720 [Bacteroidaceae bacterium]|nr:hypothetical protein [Bacteroidaceae bacterium]MBP5393845.1 hypothetical protein [Bacteroidaceae bacterium]